MRNEQVQPHHGKGGKSAVVLSGGGAEGAYEVGVLKALLNGVSPATSFQPLDPELFIGTSAGALNAAHLVSHWDDYGIAAVSKLEYLWLGRLATQPGSGNGFFRFRVDPTEIFDPRQYVLNPLKQFRQVAQDGAFLGWDGLHRFVHVATNREQALAARLTQFIDLSSFVSRQPFEDTIREEIRFDAIRRSSRKLEVVTTNWETGELRTFKNRDMSDRMGVQAILASGAVPGFFPPTEVGAQKFADGGVLLNTPLRPAIRAGADVIHMVYLDPEIKNIPMSHLHNTLEAFYRMMQIGWAFAVNDDVGDAADINRGLAILRRAAAGELDLGNEDTEAFVRVASRIEQRRKSGLRYRPLTIHRHHPRDVLGRDLGLINLDRHHLVELVERGYRDAEQHDCKESGCILPEEKTTAQAVPQQTISAWGKGSFEGSASDNKSLEGGS